MDSTAHDQTWPVDHFKFATRDTVREGRGGFAPHVQAAPPGSQAARESLEADKIMLETVGGALPIASSAYHVSSLRRVTSTLALAL